MIFYFLFAVKIMQMSEKYQISANEYKKSLLEYILQHRREERRCLLPILIFNIPIFYTAK